MAATKIADAAGEVEAVSSVKCYCCGLTEECTPQYIEGVRARYQGRWICGLCAEVVKDETLKSPERDLGTVEALKRHMSFRSSSFSPSTKPTHDLIVAMKHLLLRSLDSPRKKPLTNRTLGRTQSCFATVNVTATTQAEPQGRETGEVINNE
ncbi:uncharacterized protein LOC133317123 [Gastrolobium bilobum]|uniref:uncharacterized protein LOC133317123 n=1 Tax=Gastrolobium bilobum TaxID=150636 RepID=UPI002AB01668|nr:uncharacterized protein LOC133317123 [Gastrolobium bilobum]